MLAYAPKKKKRKYKMQFSSSIVLKIIVFSQYHKYCAAVTYSVILNQLTLSTFYDYTCLNVFIHSSYDVERLEIMKRLHETNFSFFLFSEFNSADEYCGFIFLSKNTEFLYWLENATFQIPVRIMYVSENTAEVLSLYKKYHKPKKVDYKKRIVKVATFHCPVFNIMIKNDKELVDGVETRIFKEIVKKLNLMTKVLVPRDGRWGIEYPNKTVSGGILKSVYTKESDIGFCSIWFDKSKYRYMTFSRYWEFMCLKFLIPKPKLVSRSWSGILKPLSTNLWCLVLLCTVIASGTSSALRYAEGYIFSQSVRSTSVLSEYVSIIGMLVMAINPTKNYRGNANQHLFLWWGVFALIITTSYSSSLVSNLVYPQFESMIDSVEGLVKAGFYWGTRYDPPTTQILDSNNSWHVKFGNLYKTETEEDNRVNRTLAGNYSLLTTCVGDKNFMEVDDVPANILHELRATRKCLTYFMIGFGYRRTLPYAEMADRVIRILVESGITNYWLNRMFEKEYPWTTFSKVYEYKIQVEDVKSKALSLENLEGLFALLVVGNAFATVVFAGEWFSSKQRAKEN